MNIVIFKLLGLTACVVQPATSNGNEPPEAVVSVWPPGTNICPAESLYLRCTVARGAQSVWTHRWFRHEPHTALTPNPRHLVSGDSYSITGVTSEDEGSYWCQAKSERDNSTRVLLSEPAKLSVSGLPCPLLTVTPSSRQFIRGGKFTVQCPASKINSTRWKLRQLSVDFQVRTADLSGGLCSPLEGTRTTKIPNACDFSGINSGNSGLYWCDSTDGRSSAVNITVSYGMLITMSPAHTVSEGDQVILYCQYWGNWSETTFLKDGVNILTQIFHISENVATMTISNVTRADQGFYKCASRDRKTESPESWLSVEGNSTSLADTTDSNNDAWKWISLSCCIVGLLLFIPLIGWLIRHYKYHMWCARSSRPISREEISTVDLPQTKQDVTEVQWDLSWMEMSNLLEKQYYSGS